MFKSEKKNNIQKLIPEIMQAYNVSRQLSDVGGKIFSIVNSVGVLQVLPLDDRNWLLRAHKYTPTHIYLYILAQAKLLSCRCRNCCFVSLIKLVLDKK